MDTNKINVLGDKIRWLFAFEVFNVKTVLIVHTI